MSVFAFRRFDQFDAEGRFAGTGRGDDVDFVVGQIAADILQNPRLVAAPGSVKFQNSFIIHKRFSLKNQFLKFY